MRSKGSLRFVHFFSVALLVSLTTSSAWSVSYRVLHSFSNNSSYPSSGLTADTAGNVYGTTSRGGTLRWFWRDGVSVLAD
jgi:hypothetical protein